MNRLYSLLALGLVVGILILLLRVVGIGEGLMGWFRPRPTTFTTAGPTIQLETLNQLVTTRVSVVDILTAESDSYRGTWLVRGDALVIIDLSQVQWPQKNEQTRRGTVLVPQPTILSPRVDHTRTKTWSVEKTSWVPWRGDGDALRDQAMFHAQKLVEHAARSEDNLSQARITAERLMANYCKALNWDVRVEWMPSTEAAKLPPAPTTSKNESKE